MQIRRSLVVYLSQDSMISSSRNNCTCADVPFCFGSSAGRMRRTMSETLLAHQKSRRSQWFRTETLPALLREPRAGLERARVSGAARALTGPLRCSYAVRAGRRGSSSSPLGMLIWSAAAPVVCTALAPWTATAQIVLRSAIFLIRKGAWRPPAGSAAPARRGRARGPWGR